MRTMSLPFGGRRPGRRTSLVVVSLVAATAALSACGGGSDSGGTSSLDKLTVVRGTPQVDLLSLIADAKGYFKDEGLEVELVPPSGSNVPTLIASGKADIASYSAPGALLTSQGGRITSTIYGLAGVGFADYLIGSKSTPDLDALKAKKDCKIASLPQGTLGYAAVAEFNDRLGLDCEHAPFPDVGGIVGAVSSDRADAMVGALGPYAAAINKENLPILVDTADDAARAQYFPDGGIESNVYGLAKNLKEKKASVVAYLKAVNRAREWSMDPANYTEAAKLLATYPGFEGQSVEQIQADVVETSFPFYGPVKGADGGGRVDEPTWQATIDRIATFGIPDYDADADVNEYAQAVDMSYLDDALQQ